MPQLIALPPVLYILVVLGLAIYYLFPAYVANAIPVLTGGGTPIDFQKTLRDGRRIFGEGKTYRGLITGVIMAAITGMVQQWINPWFLSSVLNAILLLPEEAILFQTPPLLGLLMGLGALLGDLGGSFMKRRLNLARGAPAPGIDQLDFLVGTVLFTFWLHPLAVSHLILLFVATPIIHLTTNVVGYLLKVKKEPW
jgi:CDP-2,3-bis-(O-geranylgeranyl)-sn-glycerol synthase